MVGASAGGRKTVAATGAAQLQAVLAKGFGGDTIAGAAILAIHHHGVRGAAPGGRTGDDGGNGSLRFGVLLGVNENGGATPLAFNESLAVRNSLQVEPVFGVTGVALDKHQNLPPRSVRVNGRELRFFPRRVASTCPIKGTDRKKVKWFVGGLFPAFMAKQKSETPPGSAWESPGAIAGLQTPFF